MPNSEKKQARMLNLDLKQLVQSRNFLRIFLHVG